MMLKEEPRYHRYGLFQAQLLMLMLMLIMGGATSFVSQPPYARRQLPSPSPSLAPYHYQCHYYTRRTPSLNLLVDVPDQFFTFTFPVLGILLSIAKNYARVRMEEAAWEQRLEEGREELLRKDPTLTEIDLRRQEAANEWSAYGVPRMQEEQAKRKQQDETAAFSSSGRQRRRVRVLDREDEDEDAGDKHDKSNAADPRDYRMTDAEIEAFELEFGVTYDPYYDDPYAEDELPEGRFDVDRLYGDRIYDNGEIFYKDRASGLFYRQGSKPRNFSFFG